MSVSDTGPKLVT